MYEKELQNLGLSEKEARVYITSLEMGPDTAQNIAKRSSVNRATAYVQIDSLKKRGLMSEFLKGKKTFYTAENPEVLFRLIEQQETELKFKKLEATKVVPDLAKFFVKSSKTSGRPNISFFEGEEGVAQIRDDFLKTKDSIIMGFVNADKVQHKFAKNQESYTNKRISNKIYSKLLYTSERGVIETFKKDPKKFREGRLMAKPLFGMDSDITIYRDKVAFISYSGNSIGVIIKSKEIADTMRSLHSMLWDASK
jgi:HTH-type transcriptional regulator, sugar sensing transcriptional regulator